MEAYLFYMQMAVVRFHYEVQKGTTGKVPSSSVKAHWVGSIPTGLTNNWTFGIAGAYASLKN